MTTIKYDQQPEIDLTDEITVLTDYTPNYAVVINRSANTVYMSKESNLEQLIGTKDITTIQSGSIGFTAADKVHNVLFIKGTGHIEIKPAYSIEECLTLAYGYLSDNLNKLVPKPNLIDNPDFAINQRGKALYHNGNYSQYTVDRWFLQEWNTKLTVTSSGVKAELDTERDSAIILCQTLYGFTPKYGEIYSLSVNQGGKIYPASGMINSTADKVEYWDGQFHFMVNYSDSAKAWTLNLISDHGAPLELEWVKLEHNTQPSQFIIPDSSSELIKCQRCYQLHSSGDIAPEDLRPSMISTPSVTKLDNGGYEYSC